MPPHTADFIMNERNYRHRNWTEFQWEREIRRDEQRISCYFRDLAGCLDLPGGEEFLQEQFSGPASPVPNINSADGQPRNSWNEHDEDEDDDENVPFRPRQDTALIDELDMLSSEWNLLSASRLRANLLPAGLGVSCAFAKLLARVEDYADADEQQERTLKLSLGKRALADINELSGAFRQLAEWQPSIERELQSCQEELGEIRERLYDRLTQLRHC